MNKLTRHTIVVILLLFSSIYLYSEEEITKKSIISKVNKFFNDNKAYKGKFILKKNRITYKGKFYFKHPNKFKFVFSLAKKEHNRTKRLISNGKRLWIYLPERNLIVDQDLSGTTPLEISSSELGMKKLLKNYQVEFDAKVKKLIIFGDKYKTVSLILRRETSSHTFKKINFYVDMETGFLVKIIVENDKGKKLILERGALETGIELGDGEFTLNPPEGARLIKDPIYSKSGE